MADGEDRYCDRQGTSGICIRVWTVEASGNGNVDLNKAAEWMKRCDDRNVSYCVWSLCNKNESSALIKSSCGKTSGWNIDDLTKAGQFIRNHYRSRMENTAENNPEVKNLAPNITVSYKTHVQTFGWENEVSNGKMAGTVGSAKRLEVSQSAYPG